MPCVTSYFNRTLFRKNLTRFWPLWFGYSLIWMILLPIYLLTALDSGDTVRYAADQILELSCAGGIALALVFGIFFAMAEFSYLTNPRATQSAHALPIRREGLFLTSYLSGLFSMLSTLVVCYTLAGFVCGMYRVSHPGALALGFAAAALAVIFFYSFGVFCMVFTGQILAAPVFYGVLNFLAVGMEYLVRLFAGNFLFGYYNSSDVLLAPLSPVVQFLSVVSPYADRVGEVSDGTTVYHVEYGIEGFGWLVAYAVVGLIFAALALCVYKTRKSEATGETVAIPWARPIFKYGVAFCMAFSLGELLYYLLFGMNLQSGEYSLPGTLTCMVFAGLLGYFGAEMLLRKSLRVWRTGRAGAAVFAAALLLIGVGMALDLTGYETRVPDAEDVAHVRIRVNSSGDYANGTFDDRETIELAINAHRAIINDKDRWLESTWHAREESGSVSEASYRVTYTLKSGLTLTRSYSYSSVYADELSDPNSPAATLTALLNADEVIRDDLLFYNEESVTVTGGEWEFYVYDEADAAMTVIPGTTDEHEETLGILTAEQGAQIYAAVKRDIALGHAAHRTLFYEGGDKNTPVFRVELYGLRKSEDDQAQVYYGNGGVATTTVEAVVDRANYDAYCSLNITPRMTEALAVLADCTPYDAR